jgi:hypothetical protein
MIKEIVLQHKKEKENLLSKKYVLREKLDFARKFLETTLIKVVTGPRRAGKSVFSCLLLRKKDFAYLNFDDENLLKINSSDEIIKGIFEVYGEAKIILFDEIQNFKNWELFVNKLQRRDFNLILTGSNARLLSKELATSLTGRYIPIEILPFSFKEFLRARDIKIKEIELPEIKGKILNHLTEYLNNGGFPEVVVKNMEAKSYLDTLVDAILLKDVVKRYKVRFPQKIYDLFLYLVSNFTNEFSFTSLRKSLNFNSTRTVQNYLEYLEEAYLIFLINRFSFKLKEQIKTPKKIYLVDNGFVLAKSFQFSQDLGKLMENLVFQELLKRGWKPNQNIFYYQTRNKREVDFIIKEGIKIKELIQVAYQLNALETQKREIKSLIEAGQELKCSNLNIITWDTEKEEEVNGKKIRIIPLWRWLLRR